MCLFFAHACFFIKLEQLQNVNLNRPTVYGAQFNHAQSKDLAPKQTKMSSVAKFWHFFEELWFFESVDISEKK